MKNSKIIDISIPISDKIPIWPGSNSPSLKLNSKISDGNDVNVSFLEMEIHTGTHFDAPYHFIETGKKSHDISLSEFVGTCFVINLIGNKVINSKVLENANIPNNCTKLLIRSNDLLHKNLKFNKSYSALEESGAEWIAQNGIKLVGIDYLSIELFENNNFLAHKTLLKNDIIILEGLNLYDVENGFYELVALPLKLENCEAAPVRAILIKE